MYKCDHFNIKELVSEETLDKYGEVKCWWLMDDRILKAADAIRKEFGSMLCNTWSSGGDRTESGLRVPGMKYYSPTSQHSYGRALDLIPLKASVSDIQYAIINDREKWAAIRGLELVDGWLHIDVRNSETFMAFKP